jgi:hypothetical protein
MLSVLLSAISTDPSNAEAPNPRTRKAGTTIAALRKGTGATILVEYAPKGCEEQVVTIAT